MRTVLLFLAFTAAVPAEKIAVRGVYSDPRPFWNGGNRLDEHGVNAVFVHAGSITAALLDRAKAEGAAVYAEFPTLNGKGYVEKHPEAWPIDENGARAPAATWFLGACPTEPGFKAFRMRQLAELLDKHDLAGVWMDYFHWHAQFEDPKPILPETCFSATCVRAFEAATGIRVPAGGAAGRFILARHAEAWRKWRCGVLAEWAREIRAVMREKRPRAVLGVYHCPWREDEFRGALRRTLGLDFDRLAETVEVFSPMVYHGRMGRPPAWVGEYVEWLSKRLPRAARIWPIVQAHGEPGKISAAEFEQVMKLGAAGRATGLMMFTFRSVAEDPAKLEVLKKLYRD